MALDDELNLDDLIGGGNYGAGDDDMSDNMSQISTISTVCNPRGKLLAHLAKTIPHIYLICLT